jgi:hypothetical protein
MRKLKIMEHISLDGVIQATGEDDFPYADWTLPYRTPAGRDELLAHHPKSLQGHRTFEDRIARRRDIVGENRNAVIRQA